MKFFNYLFIENFFMIYYKMAVQKGHASAMINYAYMLENGLGVEFNYDEAIKCYKKLIDNGNPIAITKYSNMLYKGKGVTVNKEEAIRYYEIASKKGNKEEENSLIIIKTTYDMMKK